MGNLGEGGSGGEGREGYRGQQFVELFLFFSLGFLLSQLGSGLDKRP
jgi:hypothetical protein